MFQVIGVLDLRGGVAVHARGGRRDEYVAVAAVAGDAVAAARQCVERYRIHNLYVADLDAIARRGGQSSLVRKITAVGSVWLDAGITSVAEARDAIDLGVSRVVVGLETLSSFEALRSICAAIGRDRVVFSLDLREGRPLTPSASIAGQPPEELVARAADAGAGAVIVLDLARVGMAHGVDRDLLARIRHAAPGVSLFAGGGVRGMADLVALADAGCNGALVATALYTGSLTAADISAAQSLVPRPST